MATVSWTEIRAYRECPHRHKLHYVDRWRPPEMARPLRLGILVHEVLEMHYDAIRRGRDAKAQIQKYLFEHGAVDEDDPGHEDALLAWWIYEGYREKWGRSADWQVVDVEMEVRAQLPEVNGFQFELFGRVDMLVKVNGRYLYVVDFKTGRYLPQDQELALADQFGLYVWALQQSGLPVRGAIYDAIRTHRTKGDLDGSKPIPLDKRFDREYTYRSAYELDMLAREAAATMANAYRDQATAERHPDLMNCRRCPFLEPCLAGRKAPHLETQLLEARGYRQSHAA